MVVAGRLGESVPPTGSPNLRSALTLGGSTVSVAESVSSLIFTGPLTWTGTAACRGQNDLFFAPAGERPETRNVREAKARGVCNTCAVMNPCRLWAREHREYGFWGGESEEERAAAGYRVDMPVGRVARYPKGNGTPVAPRTPRVA
jgi:WhiB family transcriptional regulator, redox-sensing transcriptional regulator